MSIQVNDMWDVMLYNNYNTQKNPTYYKMFLSEIFKYEPSISEKIIKEVHNQGKSLVISTTKNTALECRDTLILFGLKSQICPVN